MLYCHISKSRNGWCLIRNEPVYHFVHFCSEVVIVESLLCVYNNRAQAYVPGETHRLRMHLLWTTGTMLKGITVSD